MKLGRNIACMRLETFSLLKQAVAVIGQEKAVARTLEQLRFKGIFEGANPPPYRRVVYGQFFCGTTERAMPGKHKKHRYVIPIEIGDIPPTG
jgi:hypothetical protein